MESPSDNLRPDFPATQASQNAVRTPSPAATGGNQTAGDSPVKRKFVDDIPPSIGKGPAAPIWTLYRDRAGDFDKEMLEKWDTGMDSLLIFAGLLSAVVTAFLVLALGLLLPDASQAMVDGLIVLSAQLAALKDADLPMPAAYQPADTFAPAPAAAWVNGLWFISLTISLWTAVLAMLLKQWIRVYRANLSSIARDGAHQRHFRWMGLQDWKVPGIVDSLPVLLHVAVLVFFAGFPIYLWSAHLVLAWVMTAIWLTGAIAYVLSAFAPLIWPECPYTSPLTGLLELYMSPFVKENRPNLFAAIRDDLKFRRFGLPNLRDFLTQLLDDHAWVHGRADDWMTENEDLLDTRAFAWLESICSSQEDKETVLFAFFSWQPPTLEWKKCSEALGHAAKHVIAKVLTPKLAEPYSLRGKQKWEDAKPLLIKLAVCSTYVGETMKAADWDALYTSEWTSPAPTRTKLVDADHLLHLALLQHCLRHATRTTANTRRLEQLFKLSATFLAKAQTLPTVDISSFGFWLLIEDLHLLFVNKSSRNLADLQTTATQYVGSSLHLPPAFLAAIVRLWQAGPTASLSSKSHPWLRTDFDNTALIVEACEHKLPRGFLDTAQHYIVNDISASEDPGATASGYLSTLIGHFRERRYLYPERFSRLATSKQVEAEARSELLLTIACVTAILDCQDEIGDSNMLAVLQLIDLESPIAVRFFAIGLQGEDSGMTTCADLVVADDFSMLVQSALRYKDVKAVWICVLVVYHAGKLNTNDPSSVKEPPLWLAGWLKMLHEFGYQGPTERVREFRSMICEALLDLIQYAEDEVMNSGLINMMEADAGSGADDRFRQLLQKRTAWLAKPSTGPTFTPSRWAGSQGNAAPQTDGSPSSEDHTSWLATLRFGLPHSQRRPRSTAEELGDAGHAINMGQVVVPKEDEDADPSKTDEHSADQ